MNQTAGSKHHSASAGPVHDLRRIFQLGRRKRLQHEQRPMNAAEAAAEASDSSKGPKDGIVAVKVWMLSATDLSSSKVAVKVWMLSEIVFLWAKTFVNPCQPLPQANAKSYSNSCLRDC